MKIFVFVLIALIALIKSDKVLDIAGRWQWDNSGGYCGACSFQTHMLYFGNWMSQDIMRKVLNNQWVLPGHNAVQGLDVLHIKSDGFVFSDSGSQWKAYLVWAKNHIEQGHPVVITAWLAGSTYHDYDHIMPAFGIKTNNSGSTEFHPDDELVYYNNYNKTPMVRKFGDFGQTRESCDKDCDQGGCIMKWVDYGVAVTGVKSYENLQRVQMSVNLWDEPNLSMGEKPIEMKSNITVFDTEVGKQYQIFRYDDLNNVPYGDYQDSKYSYVYYFTAEKNTYEFNDPNPFMSSDMNKTLSGDELPTGGICFYRVIQNDYENVESKGLFRKIMKMFSIKDYLLRL